MTSTVLVVADVVVTVVLDVTVVVLTSAAFSDRPNATSVLGTLGSPAEPYIALRARPAGPASTNIFELPSESLPIVAVTAR